MIVANTSFLFALFGSDTHTSAAQSWARKATQPITITVLNRFEFANAIRFAAFRKMISRSEALASLAAFDADGKQGLLQLTPSGFSAVVNEAERLSEAKTVAGGHRSFDILPATTERIPKATTFLTFDVKQRRLAGAVRPPIGAQSEMPFCSDAKIEFRDQTICIHGT